ncbi:MAG: hypothetical protein NVSMB29_06920 [Candidatus Dormibacteria bacterium]
MSLPLRTRGVLAGLVTLAASPLIAVTVLSGSSSHTISPTAVASPETRPAGGTAGRGLGVRVPELVAPEAEPTPAPTPAATPAPTPEPTPEPTAAPTQAPTPRQVVPKPPAPAPQQVQPVVVQQPAAPAGSIEGIIRDAAGRHGVSGDWMMKIARCESGLNPRAVNPGGYYGLFQFSPRTFQAHGGTDIWDPYQQSEITATMLSQGQARQWSCA